MHAFTDLIHSREKHDQAPQPIILLRNSAMGCVYDWDCYLVVGEMSEAICKCSYLLGSACGGCSKCREDWKNIKALGWRLISPNVELLDAQTLDELKALRSALERLVKVHDFHERPSPTEWAAARSALSRARGEQP